MDTYSGASHFANNVNFEVQRQNHWEIEIFLDSLGIGAGKDYNKHIRLSCTQAGIPSISVQAQDLKHGNETIKVAGSPSYETSEIQVYDTIGLDMQGLLQEWFDRIFNPDTHLMGLVSSYKANANLYLYSPDATVIRTWTLYGVFPTNLRFGQLSADSAGQVVTITATLSVDRSREKKQGSLPQSTNTREV